MEETKTRIRDVMYTMDTAALQMIDLLEHMNNETDKPVQYALMWEEVMNVASIIQTSKSRLRMLLWREDGEVKEG